MRTAKAALAPRVSIGGPQGVARVWHGLDRRSGAELVKKIRREAQRQGVSWKSSGGRGSHEIFWLGATKVPIPRHKEIGERTTQDILHECEAVLGKSWWRK